MTNEKTSPLTMIRRGILLGFTNIWRNKFLSLATIAVIAIILFIFNIILAVNFVSKNIITEATRKIDLIVYLQTDVDPLEGNQMVAEIKKLPNVVKAVFRSQDEATEIMRQNSPELIELLERNKIKNTIPPDIKIVTNSIEDHRQIQNFLQAKYAERIHPLYNGLLERQSDQLLKANQENERIITNVNQNLLKFTRVTNQIIFWTILIFIVGGTLILMNAIQLAIFSRQKEIQTMKLVGATYNFIRFPYMLEGVIYGVSAFIISVILVAIIATKTNIVPLNYLTGEEYLLLFILELAATVILGLLTSIVTVNRYLKN